MRSLLRTTALASVLAFVAPYAAAEDVTPQADYSAGAQTQTQSVENIGAAGTSADVAGDAAGGNVELMAAFERLRMLDEIGEVTVVKLQPGQTPESADLEADKMIGVDTSQTADAAAEIESDAADVESEKMTGAEAGAAVDERIASGFEASGTEPAQPGAESYVSGEQTAGAELESDAPMPSVGTSAEAGTETQLGAVEQVPSPTPSAEQAEAGALFGGADQPETTGAVAGAEELQADAGQQQPSEAAGAVSATFIEDTVNQIPEIKQALEENDAAAADIVSIDIDENGDVTVFVRES